MVFGLAVRGRQSKSLHLFKAKRFVQIFAGGREAAFYSAATYARIKENINSLRPWSSGVNTLPNS